MHATITIPLGLRTPRNIMYLNPKTGLKYTVNNITISIYCIYIINMLNFKGNTAMISFHLCMTCPLYNVYMLWTLEHWM